VTGRGGGTERLFPSIPEFEAILLQLGLSLVFERDCNPRSRGTGNRTGEKYGREKKETTFLRSSAGRQYAYFRNERQNLSRANSSHGSPAAGEGSWKKENDSGRRGQRAMDSMNTSLSVKLLNTAFSNGILWKNGQSTIDLDQIVGELGGRSSVRRTMKRRRMLKQEREQMRSTLRNSSRGTALHGQRRSPRGERSSIKKKKKGTVGSPNLYVKRRLTTPR